MGTAVVSGCDVAPVLHAAECVLGAMALAIQGLAVFDHGLAAPARRDAGSDAPGGQRGTETITVVAPIAKQFACGWQGTDHLAGSLVVAHFPSAWLAAAQGNVPAIGAQHDPVGFSFCLHRQSPSRVTDASRCVLREPRR